MYHGFDREADRGLVATLAALLRENPNIKVTLLLVDRFSGGTVAAVCGVAGVNQDRTTSPQIDPAISHFEAQCEQYGLAFDCMWVPENLRAAVRAQQTLRQRVSWFLYGYWDGIIVYHITAKNRKTSSSSCSAYAIHPPQSPIKS